MVAKTAETANTPGSLNWGEFKCTKPMMIIWGMMMMMGMVTRLIMAAHTHTHTLSAHVFVTVA